MVTDINVSQQCTCSKIRTQTACLHMQSLNDINVKKLHFIHMLTATDDRSSHIKNSKNKKVILL